MATWVDCDNYRELSLETLLASIIGYDTARDAMCIRTFAKTIGTDTQVIECATKEDVEMMLRRAIHIAADGLPALNVVNGTSRTLTVPPCAANISNEIWPLLTRAFVFTNDNQVAIYVATVI